MKNQILLLFLVFSIPTFAAEFTLTEASLMKLVQSNNPSLDELETKFLQAKLEKESLDDALAPSAYIGYGHTDTKEKSIIPFQPVFKSINQYKVGVKKNTLYGISVDANQSIDVRSGDSETGSTYKDIHSSVYEIGLQIDLWKDIFGKNTRRQYKNLKELEQKAKLEKEISKNLLWLNARKLYWNLVANAEKTKITKDLLKTTRKQAKDAKRRKASSIADKAEVAIFNSRVSQREGQLLYLEYERELLFQSLREMFPELKEQSLKLEKYNKKKEISKVLACTGQIFLTNELPLKHSSYDEVIDLLKLTKDRQQKIDQAHNDIDVKFELKYQQKGVSSNTTNSNDFYGDYDDSLTDLADNDRSGMSAALQIAIPIGSQKSTTQDIREKLNKRMYRAQISSLEGRVHATYEQVKKSVMVLSKVIDTQRKNSKYLDIRVREMKKKFAQARIPEYVLFQDQESLLQSDLTIVDTQLKIINTLLDFYSIFQTYPCEFNKALK